MNRLLIFLIGLCLVPLPGLGKTIPTQFNVTDYGARGDGQTDATDAMQKAIQDCHKNGGGSVLVPAGT